MAKNERDAGTSQGSQRKRLARAKIKHPETEQGGRGSSSRSKESAPSKAALAEERKQKLIKFGIGAFAVLMAISMMVPSLAGIVGSRQQADEAASQPAPTEDEQTEDATSEGEEETKLSGMEAVDAAYAPQEASLTAKLADDENNLAALLNLGKLYMSWGYGASTYATDQAASEHVNELFGKAIEYFDRYLELHESNAVRVDRALCQFYSGEQVAARDALIQVTEDAPDYGPAWANLGLVYEMLFDTDSATQAYEKAIEADPNDEYGASSFASSRLASINANNLPDADAAEAGEEEENPEGLSETLADATGTNF